MTDGLLEIVHGAMGSPWICLLLFLVSAIDGFFPVVPGETSVITAGVFAASGEPGLAPVILAAALGAFAGDHVSYLLGRSCGERLLRRARPGTRRARAFAWAERALAERGGLVLVVARYIPGGRTAVTLTMGATGFPVRRFALFDAVAALSWAVYSALIGYLGGVAFENDPIRGLLLGLGLAFTVTVLTEAVRHLRRRRSAGRAGDPAPAPDHPAPVK